MKTLLYIILIGFVVFFLIPFILGIIKASIINNEKKRTRLSMNTFLLFSNDAKSMIIDILDLHENKKIQKINAILKESTNTTNELLSKLRIEDRPSSFSSGKKLNNISFSAYKTEFIENGYSEISARLLSGIFLFEIDKLFNIKKMSKKPVASNVEGAVSPKLTKTQSLIIGALEERLEEEKEEQLEKI